jgi:hypothetical protein
VDSGRLWLEQKVQVLVQQISASGT